MAWAELDSYELGKATKGEQFFVWWDGVQYECYADADGASIFIGNPGIWYEDMEQDNGVPFVIECLDGCFVGSYAFDGDHTIRVAKMVETVHPIDPKYLPKGGFGYTEKNVVMEETVITKSGIVLPIELIEGALYDVSWDGEVFRRRYSEDGGIGNLGILDLAIGTDEPFLILRNDGVDLELFHFGDGEHTISIAQVIYHTLDQEYLPCDMRIELNGYLWSSITADDVRITSGNVQNIVNKIWRGELVNVRVRSVYHEGSVMAQAKEIEADVCYYSGYLVVNWLCANSAGGWHAKRISFNADGIVKGIGNRILTTTT